MSNIRRRSYSVAIGIPVLTCLLWAGVGVASADVVSYSGTFTYDDDLQLISLNLPWAKNVTVSSTSTEPFQQPSIAGFGQRGESWYGRHPRGDHRSEERRVGKECR